MFMASSRLGPLDSFYMNLNDTMSLLSNCIYMDEFDLIMFFIPCNVYKSLMTFFTNVLACLQGKCRTLVVDG